MSKSTIKVVFAIDVTTADGKARTAGSSAVLPAAEARELVHWGRARRVEADATPAKKSTPKKKAAAKKAASNVADTTNSADPSKADGGESTGGNTP